MHTREYFLFCFVFNRDEPKWRYIDTISIRRATQRDISRYDPDIRKQGKSLRCHSIFIEKKINLFES